MKKEIRLHLLLKSRREKEEENHLTLESILLIPGIPREGIENTCLKLIASISTSMVSMRETVRKREMLQGPTVALRTTCLMIKEGVMIE